MIHTSLVFDHRGRTEKGKEGPIEVRVTVARKPYYINTGVRVRKNEWHTGSICNRIDCVELNERLAIISKAVQGKINDYLREGKDINVAEIRQSIYVNVVEKGSAFLDWVDETIPQLVIDDNRHYITLSTRLYEFGTIRTWDDLTVENIYKFDTWLHQLPARITKNERKMGKVPERISDASVYNYHKCLKALLNRAKQYGKISQSPYDSLTGKFNRGDKENPEYLTEEELRRIEELTLPALGDLDAARDLFVCQCYTGMAYSDLMAFDISDYKHVEGKWIKADTRIKSGIGYISQLLPPVVRILEKWEMTLPYLANPKYNEKLKTIGEMAKIKTKLHSHLGRHTFGTLMLSNGVKIQNLKTMMGHKRITQTEIYAKVLAKDVHTDFDMIAEKLGKKNPSQN